MVRSTRLRPILLFVLIPQLLLTALTVLLTRTWYWSLAVFLVAGVVAAALFLRAGLRAVDNETPVREIRLSPSPQRKRTERRTRTSSGKRH